MDVRRDVDALIAVVEAGVARFELLQEDAGLQCRLVRPYAGLCRVVDSYLVTIRRRSREEVQRLLGLFAAHRGKG